MTWGQLFWTGCQRSAIRSGGRVDRWLTWVYRSLTRIGGWCPHEAQPACSDQRFGRFGVDRRHSWKFFGGRSSAARRTGPMVGPRQEIAAIPAVARPVSRIGPMLQGRAGNDVELGGSAEPRSPGRLRRAPLRLGVLQQVSEPIGVGQYAPGAVQCLSQQRW